MNTKLITYVQKYKKYIWILIKVQNRHEWKIFKMIEKQTFPATFLTWLITNLIFSCLWSKHRNMVPPWRKRLDACLPPLGSRLRVSVIPCGFHGGQSGVWVVSLGVSPVFPCHKFHSAIPPHSSRLFRPPLWWCIRCGWPTSLLFTDFK